MEKEIILLTASEAKELSIKNCITIQNISQSIESQCKNGFNSIRIFDSIIPFELMQILLELGYSISKSVGQFKEDITIISW